MRLDVAFSESWLLGGFWRLALASPRAVFAVWAQSALGQVLVRRLKVEDSSMARWCHGYGLALGWWLLLLLLALGGTGTIAVGVWALFAWTLVTAVVMRRWAWLLQPSVVDAWVVLFFLTAMVATGFSSWWSASVVGFAKFATFLAAYVVFRSMMVQWPASIGFGLAGLLWVGVAESVVGLWQSQQAVDPLATWVDPDTNPEEQMTRVFGTLQPLNPNLLAGFLLPCLAAALAVVGQPFISAMAQAASSAAKMRLCARGVALLLLGAVVAVGLLLTGSRGGYLGLLGLGVALYAYSGHLLWHDNTLGHYVRWLKRLWLFGIALLTGLVAVGLATSQSLRHRVMSIFSLREDSSISYRLNVYASAWQMFSHNWGVGIGPGNSTFKQVYGIYMVPGYNALGAYSVPLEIAVEQGVMGLLAAGGLLLTLLLRAFWVAEARVPNRGFSVDAAKEAGPLLTLRDQTRLIQKWQVGCLLAGLVAMWAHGLFDTVWYRPAVNITHWFFVAALVTLTENFLKAHGSPVQASPSVLQAIEGKTA
ncbi:MAG: O-antigen ligase family protein [Candidatus Melainabacteria bacterium]|nr:O-antigen ligase family protein [Candidatus Melainabacteria bacterium]